MDFRGHGSIACMYALVKRDPRLASRDDIRIETRRETLPIINDLKGPTRSLSPPPRRIPGLPGLPSGDTPFPRPAGGSAGGRPSYRHCQRGPADSPCAPGDLVRSAGRITGHPGPGRLLQGPGDRHRPGVLLGDLGPRQPLPDQGVRSPVQVPGGPCHRVGQFRSGPSLAEGGPMGRGAAPDRAGTGASEPRHRQAEDRVRGRRAPGAVRGERGHQALDKDEHSVEERSAGHARLVRKWTELGCYRCLTSKSDIDVNNGGASRMTGHIKSDSWKWALPRGRVRVHLKKKRQRLPHKPEEVYDLATCCVDLHHVQAMSLVLQIVCVGQGPRFVAFSTPVLTQLIIWLPACLSPTMPPE